MLTSKTINVVVQKPALPLLWLDTSIIIGVSRRDTGAVSGTDPRIDELVDVVRKKVIAGKLLCLESDQHREVAGHPNAHEIKLALDTITLGVRIRSAPEVADAQVVSAMRAFIKGSGTVFLSPSMFLDRDPVARSARVRRRRWWITIVPHMRNNERRAAKRAKFAELSVLEEIRQRNVTTGRSFQGQLEIERREAWNTYSSYTSGSWLASIRRSPTRLQVVTGSLLLDKLQEWKSTRNILDLPRFSESEHFLALPFNHIRHQLSAEILTASRPVSKSDPMDIMHMSHALPIATWVLTEKSLTHRVHQLKLDVKWGAQVFSLRTVHELIETLKSL